MITQSGVFGESRVSSRNRYFWLETKAGNKSLPAVYLAENVLTKTSTLSGGSLYINISMGGEAKFMRILNCQTKYPMVFQPELTGAQHILLKVLHDGEWTEFYFETYTEALNFQEFLKSPNEALLERDLSYSPQSSPNKSEKQAQDQPLLGWDEHLSKRDFSDENIDRAIDMCFQAYLQLDLSDSSAKPISVQIETWKQSIKWYNEILRRLTPLAQPQQVSVFKSNFARSLKGFFTTTWNKHYSTLSYSEVAVYHSVVSNIQKNTTVFSAFPALSTNISTLLQAPLLSIESRFLASFSAGVRHLLQTLFSKESFVLSGPRVVAQNALEIVRLLSSLSEQLEEMDPQALGELLRSVCAA